jgi:hypothetical protein
MKKIITGGLLLLISIGGIAFAQTISKRISSIDVNFDTHIVTLTPTVGYYDNSGMWQTVGVTESAVTIADPAYSQVMNVLDNTNAMNLNLVEAVIQNSI